MKLVAFDLDGTTVDTLQDLFEAGNHTLRKNGYPELSDEAMGHLVGHSVYYMSYHMLPEEVREREADRINEEVFAYYGEHMCDHTRPYEGIPELLTELKKRGYLLAVVTNKPHRFAHPMVERLFPAGTFDLVLGMTECIRKKPDPHPLQFVMEYLLVSPEDTIYVGDSEVDIAFARNTGIPCISVPWGTRTEAELTESGAQVIARSCEEVLKYIEEWDAGR